MAHIECMPAPLVCMAAVLHVDILHAKMMDGHICGYNDHGEWNYNLQPSTYTYRGEILRSVDVISGAMQLYKSDITLGLNQQVRNRALTIYINDIKIPCSMIETLKGKPLEDILSHGNKYKSPIIDATIIGPDFAHLTFEAYDHFPLLG